MTYLRTPAKSHPQKRVLVEHVSDDVRALKQGTDEQQKVVLTGRAIADLLTGDTFDENSHFDAKYFTDGVPDFNKVTDASIRYVTWEYAHGPEGITIPGFLYTFVQLPSGKLTWTDNNETYRDHDGELAIRQIFYVEEQCGDIESYTRTAKNIAGEWIWSPYWHTMSGKIIRIYIGPEQAAAGLLRSANLRPDAIYEMHCGGQRITLPDADTWRLGATVAFEQYANPDPNGATWSNIVESTEVLDVSGKTETYETILTPPLQHGRTSEKDLNAGMWHTDVSQASVYKFDCADREGQGFKIGSKTYSRTWLLDVDPEAITALADITSLLGAHTDQFIPDIVRYGDRYQDNDPQKATKKAVTLVTSRQASMSGHIKFAIKFNPSSLGNLSNNFRIRIYRYNENTDAEVTTSFEYAKTKDVVASLYKKYYITPDGSTFNAVNGTGYTDSFIPGVDYYERTVQWSSLMTPADWMFSNESAASKADFLGKTDGSFKRTDSRLSKVLNPQTVGLVGYIKAYRNDTILVVITSDDHYADSKIVSPSVEFYPDSHDSYISKLRLDNESIFPKQLAESTTPGPKEEQVAGATALTNAVKMMINQLQGKGLFWGAVPVDAKTLDTVATTGIYNTTGTGDSKTGNSPFMASNGNIPVIVLGSEIFNASQLDRPDASSAIHGGNWQPVTQIAIVTNVNKLASDSPTTITPGMWIRYGVIRSGRPTWSLWTSMQQSPCNCWHSVSGDTTIAETAIVNDLAYGSPYIVLEDAIDAGGVVTVNLPRANLYPHTKFTIETRGCKIRLRQTDCTTGEEYEFNDETIATAPDHMLYPIQSDGNKWYVIVAS